MGNSLQNPGGWDTGDVITGPQLIGIDQGQARAWVNDGETQLQANASVDGDAAYALSLTNLLSLFVNTQNFMTFQVGGGAGSFAVNAATLDLAGAVTVDAPPLLASPLVVTRHQLPFQMVPVGYDGIDFTGPNNSGLAGCTWCAGVSFAAAQMIAGSGSNHAIRLLLGDLPPGMTITSVELLVDHNTATALPSTKPGIYLHRYSPSTTPNVTTVGGGVDPTLTLAAYKAPHYISAVPTATEVVVAGARYSLEVDSGGGGGAGFSFYGAFVSGTFPSLKFF